MEEEIIVLTTYDISNVEIGAARISYIVPLNFGKNIPNEVLLIDWVNKVNISNPGTINDP